MESRKEWAWRTSWLDTPARCQAGQITEGYEGSLLAPPTPLLDREGRWGCSRTKVLATEQGRRQRGSKTGCKRVCPQPTGPGHTAHLPSPALTPALPRPRSPRARGPSVGIPTKSEVRSHSHSVGPGQAAPTYGPLPPLCTRGNRGRTSPLRLPVGRHGAGAWTGRPSARPALCCHSSTPAMRRAHIPATVGDTRAPLWPAASPAPGCFMQPNC